MDQSEALFPLCSRHGKPTKRDTCRECNAAYMRTYLRRRRHQMPARPLWERARKRAKDRGLPFNLTKDSIVVPRTCPALGLPIQLRRRRSACSPSLDRIVPKLGYVPGNIRVISDRANRLKGGRTLNELRHLAENGPLDLREEYRMVVTYVEREQLLEEVRAKAQQGGRAGQEWTKIATFLDRVFRKSLIK
jgi:hypothetical protein